VETGHVPCALAVRSPRAARAPADAVTVDGGGAGTMVADDGALAVHHGEGGGEVRWTARSATHQVGERRRHCGRNSVGAVL
jgi:hypothetical protein